MSTWLEVIAHTVIAHVVIASEAKQSTAYLQPRHSNAAHRSQAAMFATRPNERVCLFDVTSCRHVRLLELLRGLLNEQMNEQMSDLLRTQHDHLTLPQRVGCVANIAAWLR